jgi:acetylornithine deacetylase/succinyl-diaminopimelate desuccinylase-like protein
MAALEEKRIPTILSGFDLPEGNIHSPNERFRIEHIPLGVETAKEIYRSLADLRSESR